MLSPDDVLEAFPLAEFMGSYGEPAVQDYLRSIFYDLGLRGHFLTNETAYIDFPDESLPKGFDELVFKVDGLPFYLVGETLVPFGTNAYHTFRDHYKPVILSYQHERILFNYYPVMDRFDTFYPDMKSFLKSLVWKRTDALERWAFDDWQIAYPDSFDDLGTYLNTLPNRFNSHFSGEKSGKVAWRSSRHPDEIKMVRDEMREHFYATWKRLNPDYPFNKQEASNAWDEYADQDEQAIVFAVDTESNRTVAAMNLAYFPQFLSLECGFITTIQDEQYKPYSLVTCAHIAAGWLAYSLGADCSYGRISDASGAYKMTFGKLEPLLALKVR